MIRLDIGSGKSPLKGYTGVDIDSRADVVADMGDLPFCDNEVERIYSTHALEHVSKFRVVPILREWARVIKPGLADDGTARMILRVPSLIWCLEHLLAVARAKPDRCDGWDMAVVFGSQTQDNGKTIHPGEFHQTGFTPELMTRYLFEAGLTVIKFEILWTHGQETLSFEVVKDGI